jgi:hypothetical protein
MSDIGNSTFVGFDSNNKLRKAPVILIVEERFRCEQCRRELHILEETVVGQPT